MENKIRDILPPEESIVPPPQKEEPEVEVEQEEKIEEVPKEIKINWGWIFILLFLIAAVVISFRISKAEVKVWPETDTVSYRTTVSVNTTVNIVDFENEVIPGYLFDSEETISETFPSSGQGLKKAEGVIRLYNEYTTQSEEWLAGTRFMSSEGKLFKSKDEISVPGAQITDGKMTASFVDVPVEAAQAGEEYNIGPSHFSIVAYKGTAKYTKYYGESSEAMTGGGSSFAVTAQDIEDAKESLTDKVKERAITVLGNKIGNEFVFLEDVPQSEVLDIFSLAEEGDVLKEFNCAAKAKATTIVFKKEDIKSFVKDFISSKTPLGKLIYEDSLKIDYTPQVVNLESGKISVALNFSAKIYPDINLQLLKEELSGKSLTEAQSLLEGQSEFIGSEVKLWPFWARKVPSDFDKIEIQYPIIDTSM